MAGAAIHPFNPKSGLMVAAGFSAELLQLTRSGIVDRGGTSGLLGLGGGSLVGFLLGLVGGGGSSSPCRCSFMSLESTTRMSRSAQVPLPSR